MATSFFQELAKKKYAPLSPQQERELVIRAQNGDRKARQELIERNLRFIAKRVSEYRPATDDKYLELVNAGVIGLSKAIDKFDPSKNTRLLSFAWSYIFHEIYNELLQETSLLAMPYAIRRLIYLLYRHVPELEKELGRPPTTEEVYIFLRKKKKLNGVSKKDVEFIMQKKHLVFSFEELKDDDDKRDFLERYKAKK
jgi:RNA polymerase primary sigma factor